MHLALHWSALSSGSRLAFAILLTLFASAPAPDWTPGPAMAEARDGAATAVLSDGRLLVCGGAGADGVTATAELLLPDGTFAAAASMTDARRDHAAVRLADGRVLVVGGTSGNAATASAEIYDPATDSWSSVGSLAQPRSGAVALLLPDGRVLVLGGEDGGAALSTLEVFDPSAGAFSTSASEILPARKDLAAALLTDGRVLIAGGTTGAGASARSDVFDPLADSLAAGADLLSARAGHFAIRLDDGNVLVGGGYDGIGDLASVELYVPALGVFVPAPGALAIARRHALAFLLPDNGGVLVAGGSSDGLAATSTEIFRRWTGAFVAGGSLATARPGAAGSPAGREGAAIVLGGGGLASSELTTFATVRTDQEDYLPGEFAEIAGAGFAPGATVTLQVVHLTGGCGCGEGHDPWNVVADELGSFSADWYVDPDDSVNARFLLTADASDGQHAERSFTDSPKVGSVAVGTQSPDPVLPGANAMFPITVNRGSGPGSSGSFDAALSITSTLPTGVTASFSPNPVHFAPANNSMPSTLTLATTAATPLGSSAFTVRAGTSANDFATNTGSLEVRADQTISFTQPPDKVYGDPSFALVASATSGLPVSFAVLSGPATVSGSTLTITAAGVVTVRASQAGNSSYNPAPNVDRTFTVATRPVTVTADAKSKVYGEADPALTYQITSGSLVSGDAFSGALSRAAGEGTGTHAIQQGTLALSSNYALTFAGADLSVTQRPVTVTADAKSKVYGEADPALTYQITNGSLAFSDAFSGALTRAAGESVGTHAIQQGTLTLGTNYALTFVGADLSVTQRPMTVTADARSKIYGEADPALTYQITSGSLAFSDAFSGALARTAGENVGAHAIQQGTLTLGSNYALTFVGADLSVTQRPVTVTADPQTKIYGEADPALTYQITSGSLAFSDAFSGALARAAGESVGTHAIQQGTLTLGSNYALTFVGADLSVTQRPVTVTADAKSRVYGEADPALTYQITSGSLAFSDAFTGALTRTAGENVGTHAIQQGTLTLGTNYALTFVGADLSVTQRPVTVTADSQTKVYGEADPALTYQITSGSLAFSDAFSGTLARTAGENVGTHAIQQGTLTLGTNYALTFVGADLSVTQRPVTVTADPQTKVYGEADPALTYKITSGSLAFSDAFGGALTRAAGESVGMHAIQQGTLSLGGNYALTFVGADLSVTQRPVTVTADPQSKVYGEADPTLTYQVTSGSLAFSDAFGGALTRAAGEDVGAHTIEQGTLSLGGNYHLTFVGANLTVTARPVTVAADPQTKVYGEADPDLTYQIVSGSLQYSDGFLGSLTRVSGEEVGPHAIQQGTLTLGGNYALTFVGANLLVTHRPVTVTADAKSKVYGEADPALTYQITSGSLVSGDAFSGALSRAAGEGVGTHAIQQGTLALSSNYAFTFAGANLTVTQRSVTVTADAKSKVYGEADPALTYQITSGSLAFSDAFSGALWRAAGEDVGAHAIQQGTLSLGANYGLTFVGANLSVTQRPVTVTADAKSKVYGEADPGLTYQLTSGSLAFADAFGGALTRTAGENVGTRPILQGSLSLGANYALNFVGAGLSITQRPLTVTPADASRPFASPNPPLSGTLTGVVSGDGISASYSTTATLASGAGSYPITASLNDPNGKLGNYAVTSNSGTLTITAADQTIDFAPLANKVLGQSPFALSATSTSGLPVSLAVLSGPATLSGSTVTITGIGLVTVRASQAGNSNYNAAPAVDRTFWVQYAGAGTICRGAASHAILQPINPDGSSVCKWKSSVPAKFRVADASGNSIGTPGVVTGFYLYQVVNGTSSQDVNEPVVATNTSTSFQWDPSDQQWIFVIDTKPLAAGRTYYYRIELNDGTNIQFSFGLR